MPYIFVLGAVFALSLSGCTAQLGATDGEYVTADVYLGLQGEGEQPWRDVILQRFDGGYALGDMLFSESAVVEHAFVAAEDVAALVQSRAEAHADTIDEGDVFEDGASREAAPLAEALSGEGAPDIEAHEQALAFKKGVKLWPKGVVPYEFDSSVSKKLRKRIKAAIAHWHEKTKIRFIRRDKQADYVLFVKVPGYCASYVGKAGGAQPIFVSGVCGRASIIHELGHTLGAIHEHQRKDRAWYVNIFWDNIIPGAEVEFQSIDTRRKRSRYDYKSIMHYPSRAFGTMRQDGKRRITIKKKSGETIGINRQLSKRDIRYIHKLYDK